MLQLAFSSTMALPMDMAEIDALVARIRGINAQAGITGSMIVGGNRFAEIMEGEEQAVTAAFGRVCRDKRHHAIVLLGRRRIDMRSFPDTAMAFSQIAPLGTAMSLSTMAGMLRDEAAHQKIYRLLRQYASVLAAA